MLPQRTDRKLLLRRYPIGWKNRPSNAKDRGIVVCRIASEDIRCGEVFVPMRARGRTVHTNGSTAAAAMLTSQAVVPSVASRMVQVRRVSASVNPLMRA